MPPQGNMPQPVVPVSPVPSTKIKHTRMFIVLIVIVLVLAIVGVVLQNMPTNSEGGVVRDDVILAAYDSGETLAVRKAAILRLVSKGPKGISSQDKEVIAGALQGERVTSFGFTPAEIDQIYTVINN